MSPKPQAQATFLPFLYDWHCRLKTTLIMSVNCSACLLLTCHFYGSLKYFPPNMVRAILCHFGYSEYRLYAFLHAQRTLK